MIAVFFIVNDLLYHKFSKYAIVYFHFSKKHHEAFENNAKRVIFKKFFIDISGLWSYNI